MKRMVLLFVVQLYIAATVAAPVNSTRADSCSLIGERGCSIDCEYVTYCSQANNWIVIDHCPQDTVCHLGECVSTSQHTCGASGAVSCGQHSAGNNFPNLEDCSKYYYCSEDWQPPTIKVCSIGYYDPLADTCDLTEATQCNQYTPCTGGNDGLDAVVFGNPSLHFVCMSGTTILSKCSQGFYDPKVGECIGSGHVACDE